jgi:hypothetical protein
MKSFLSALPLFVFSAVIFSSCAFHHGGMQSSASLTDGNFMVVKLATGRAAVTRVLGLGGVSTEALVFDAKQNLYQNFPLEQGQVLANITVDFKRGFYLFWDNTIVTVTGEIIEFSNPPKVDFKNKALLLRSASTQGRFSLEHEVIVKNYDGYRKATIVDFDGKSSIIRFMDHKNRLRFKTFNPEMIFVLENDTSLTQFQIGETVKVPYRYIEGVSDSTGANVLVQTRKEAEVIGLSDKRALILCFSKKGRALSLQEFDYYEIRSLSKEEKEASQLQD